MKLCQGPGPAHLAVEGDNRCAEHRAELAKRHDRGTTATRGYGAAHQRAREAWAPIVARGGTCCARCGQPIVPGTSWALDHNDERTGYLGPSHRRCNDEAGGIRSAELR